MNRPNLPSATEGGGDDDHGNHLTQATTAITARLAKNGRLARRTAEIAATRMAMVVRVIISQEILIMNEYTGMKK